MYILILFSLVNCNAIEDSTFEQEENNNSLKNYADISGNWAEAEIGYMLNNGYMSGYPDGTFRPENELSRAEYATMLVNCLNPQADPSIGNITFPDIVNHWAEDNIIQAAKAGYLSGFPDGTFKPNEPITKTQIIVSVANGLDLSGGQNNSLPVYFDDNQSIADWAKQSISNAVTNKFIYNYPDIHKLEPNKNATRSEATALIYRSMNHLNLTPNIDNIYNVKFGFTINIPSLIKQGESITFSGGTAGLSKLKFTIDGYPLQTIYPQNNTWSFNYTFNSTGTNRNLKVELFENTSLVSIRNHSITIQADVPIITTKQQYDVAVNTNVYKLSGRNGFFFEAEMTIDADGAPHAYHPDNIGLDYLANAGYPGNWWGIATNSSGTPYIQSSTDPAPGYYVSTTAIEDTRYGTSNPRRYANSEELPFMVLPAYKAMGASLGDFAVIYNQRNGKYCYGIYADIGPTNHLGEASIKAAELLNINSNPKSGGQSGDIIYLVFPNTRIQSGRIPSHQSIIVEATTLFEAWGGIQQLEYFY